MIDIILIVLRLKNTKSTGVMPNNIDRLVHHHSSSHVIWSHRLLTAFMRTTWSWTTVGACHSGVKLSRQTSKSPVSGVKNSRHLDNYIISKYLACANVSSASGFSCNWTSSVNANMPVLKYAYIWKYACTLRKYIAVFLTSGSGWDGIGECKWTLPPLSTR